MDAIVQPLAVALLLVFTRFLGGQSARFVSVLPQAPIGLRRPVLALFKLARIDPLTLLQAIEIGRLARLQGLDALAKDLLVLLQLQPAFRLLPPLAALTA